MEEHNRTPVTFSADVKIVKNNSVTESVLDYTNCIQDEKFFQVFIIE